MRILHIGTSLPDIRVEKTMQLDKLRGDEPAIVFYNENRSPQGEFEFKQYSIRVTSLNINGYKREAVQKQLHDIIETFDPDLLHVHDIYNAIFVLGLDIPWIYNDHEGWSLQSAINKPLLPKYTIKYWKLKIGLKLKIRHILKYEAKILKNRSTITVSPKIGNIHENAGGSPQIMPNYPMLSEIPQIENYNKVECSSTYIGDDLTRFSAINRNTTGLLDLMITNNFKFKVIGDKKLSSSGNLLSTGRIPHHQIYDEIKDYQFGLLPYHPHSFHSFTSPNKAYIYAHMGLILISPKTYEFDPYPKNRQYTQMSEIPELLRLRISDDETPDEIVKFAKENLIWDKLGKELEIATKLCMEKGI